VIHKTGMEITIKTDKVKKNFLIDLKCIHKTNITAPKNAK
ncbi:unnamed protein product, partial [marine sediment metagenome]